MNAEIMLVTPDRAKLWLMHNSSNRALRPSRVRQYANDMRNGNWNLTGQGITFGKDGSLLDGQHRLTAIVSANVSVKMLVVTEADVCGTYDGNLVRSSFDKFKMFGAPNVPLYGSNGLSTVRLAYMIMRKSGLSSKDNPTFEELKSYIEQEYDDFAWITDLMAKGTHGTAQTGVRGLRRGIIGASLFCIYKVSELTKTDIEHIARVLKTGMADSDRDAPIVAMRNRLISTVGSGREIDTEIFLRMQYMCMQWIKRKTAFMTRLPKENLFKFKCEEKNNGKI